MPERRKPGAVRDAIIASFTTKKNEQTLAEIRQAVAAQLGEDVPASSVRSYLNLNSPGTFIRTGPGTYRLVRR